MKIALLLKSLSYKPDPPTKESLLSQQVVNFYLSKILADILDTLDKNNKTKTWNKPDFEVRTGKDDV